MKALFVVREAGSRKIVSVPCATKAEAKAIRNKMDPDSAQISDVLERQAKFQYVVSYGPDHDKFGRKHRNNKQRGDGSKRK